MRRAEMWLTAARRIEGIQLGCYNRGCSKRSRILTARDYRQFRQVRRSPQLASVRSRKRGQVAQVVERSPEKAGVGGSTPSLATTFQRT
jgi:hypothetical protein